ncbi:unnamed protein product, partial [Trichobilharzia szidati]
IVYFTGHFVKNIHHCVTAQSETRVIKDSYLSPYGRFRIFLTGASESFTNQDINSLIYLTKPSEYNEHELICCLKYILHTGTFTVKHSLRQCMKKEANAHTAQWRSVSAAVDCEHYKPSGNKKDLQELKSNIEISYRRRMLFGNIMLLKKIHETLAEKLTR